MAKRVDNDSTMEVSSSQLEPGRPVVPRGQDKNDVSMWIGGVVGADAFAAGKTKPIRRRRGLVIAIVALLFVGAAGAGYYLFGRTSTPVAVPAVATPADARVSIDAAAPADAAVLPDAGLVDAGAPDALKVDATSGADPKPKPATKKKPVKKTVKKVVKKKTATHH